MLSVIFLCHCSFTRHVILVIEQWFTFNTLLANTARIYEKDHIVLFRCGQKGNKKCDNLFAVFQRKIEFQYILVRGGAK